MADSNGDNTREQIKNGTIANAEIPNNLEKLHSFFVLINHKRFLSVEIQKSPIIIYKTILTKRGNTIKEKIALLRFSPPKISENLL